MWSLENCQTFLFFHDSHLRLLSVIRKYHCLIHAYGCKSICVTIVNHQLYLVVPADVCLTFRPRPRPGREETDVTVVCCR